MCFLESFWVFFGVLKREKMQREARQKGIFRKNMSSPVWGVLGAIYSLWRENQGGGLWIGLDFQFLKRYGTQKSNSRIKNYGSRKFTMHRSVRHSSFHDTSAVSTPISTHEQSLEQELENLRNGIGLNLFRQLDQNQGFRLTQDRLQVKLGQNCFKNL